MRCGAVLRGAAVWPRIGGVAPAARVPRRGVAMWGLCGYGVAAGVEWRRPWGGVAADVVWRRTLDALLVRRSERVGWGGVGWCGVGRGEAR